MIVQVTFSQRVDALRGLIHVLENYRLAILDTAAESAMAMSIMPAVDFPHPAGNWPGPVRGARFVVVSAVGEPAPVSLVFPGMVVRAPVSLLLPERVLPASLSSR